MAGDSKPAKSEREGLGRFMQSYFGKLAYGLIWAVAIVVTTKMIFGTGYNRDPGGGIIGLCILAGSLAIARAIRGYK